VAIVVTRPEPDGSRLAHRLAGLGYEPVLCPLMQIEVDPDAVIAADREYQALLVTSANGLRAISRTGQAERLVAIPLIAVGPASARLAAELGFADVCEAAGDVKAVADLVRRTLSATDGPLLYVTGNARAGDLKGDLEKDGFAVDRLEAYSAVPATQLDEACAAAIRSGDVDAVMLYSPRTARIWARLIKSQGLADKAEDLLHICLSPAVADAVNAEFGQNLTNVVASAPNDDAMLEALANTGKNKPRKTDMANRNKNTRTGRKAAKPAVIDATATEVTEDATAAATEPAEQPVESAETATSDSSQPEERTEPAADGSGGEDQPAASNDNDGANPPESSKPAGKGKWIAAGLAAMLLAGVAGGGYLYHAYGERLFGQPQAAADIAAIEGQVMDATGAAQSASQAAAEVRDQVGALDGRIAGLEKQVSEMSSTPAPELEPLVAPVRDQAEAAAKTAQAVAARTSTLEDSVAKLRKSLDSVQQALQSASASGGGADLTGVNLKLDELASRIDTMSSAAAAPSPEQVAEIAALKQQLSASEERISALASQLEAATAQLQALTSRLDEVPATANQDADATVAKIAEAIAGLDAAVRSGGAFDGQLAALREAVPDAPALPALDANAGQGIPAATSLRQELAAVADELGREAAATRDASSGFLATLQSKLSSVVRVRSLDQPDWRETAAAALKAFDEAGAEAAIAALPAQTDNMPASLKDWLIGARKHVAAAQELERLPQKLLSSVPGQSQ
jgi:uroporphyrinogen-III synthase